MSRAQVIAYEAVGHRGALQYVPELVPFLEFVMREQPRVVVEIGSASGGMLWALAQAAASGAVLVSIDMEAHAAPPCGAGQRIEMVTAHSSSAAARARVVAAGAVDLLFIDGDHHYHAAKRDHELYAPLVRDAGIVAFHDIGQVYGPVEVKPLWEELRSEAGEWWEWCESGAGIGAYRKGSSP